MCWRRQCSCDGGDNCSCDGGDIVHVMEETLFM